ncbi:MAG TPA: Rrf2 family transcriptional regulator [Sphaerochaeta sp.]|nr:Rrf2 family transcriptional regulator [Sphaerochaeta sp.]
MKVSTRGRYGLRLLVDLAEHTSDQPVALSQVAARQGLSEKYLQQVALLLTRGGYLNSVKGAGGGYLLSRNTDQILIYDVFDLLEGNIAFTEIPQKEETAIQRCLRVHFFQKLDEKVLETFEGVTLADVTKAEWFTYII